MQHIHHINHILDAGESETIEFKTTFGRETIETLVAFANTNGGTVLVGVKDHATVCGVDIGKETLNQWLGQIKSATSPLNHSGYCHSFHIRNDARFDPYE